MRAAISSSLIAIFGCAAGLFDCPVAGQYAPSYNHMCGVPCSIHMCIGVGAVLHLGVLHGRGRDALHLLIWCAVRRIKRPTGAHRGGGVADALGDLPGDLDLLLHAAARCYGYAAEQVGDRARPMVQERACSIS